MRLVRVYSDEAGDCRFDESHVDLRGVDFGGAGLTMDLAEPLIVERLIFASVPPGHLAGRHTAPHRQFFVQMGGVIEVEGADGVTIRTGPGDITLIEDTHGKGHITRVVGEEAVTGAFVQLPG